MVDPVQVGVVFKYVDELARKAIHLTATGEIGIADAIEKICKRERLRRAVMDRCEGLLTEETQ